RVEDRRLGRGDGTPGNRDRTLPRGRLCAFGAALGKVEWPAGLDPYTMRNPAFIDDIGSEAPYYPEQLHGPLVGPSQLQYSPDGSRLSFLLGEVGEWADSRLYGARLVVSMPDGSEAAFVTEDYWRIRDYAWSPDSTTLYVVFFDGRPKAAKDFYIGTIEI